LKGHAKDPGRAPASSHDDAASGVVRRFFLQELFADMDAKITSFILTCAVSQKFFSTIRAAPRPASEIATG